MTERSSASSAAGSSKATSSKSSASSATSSKTSASTSKSNASSASSSKSNASSASGSDKSTSKTGTPSVADSETTERTITEMGSQAGGGGSVSATAEGYDTSMAQSAYATGGNLGGYSMAGPAMNKGELSKMASQLKAAVNANKMEGASRDGGGGGKPTGRKVFVMRHGERMDRLFPEWLTMAITDEGKYRPYDMNQPLTMIERVGGVGWAGYEHDSPITEMGSLSGQMVGRGLKSCKVDVKQVVSSPALRCIQTANAILKAIENADLKICVEPGLFEWLTWYDKMPQWFEPQTLSQTGKYRINEMYKPIMSVADIVTKKNETTKEYCERVANVTKQLMEQFKNNNSKCPGTMLVVGHGSTMDVVGRSLMNKPMQELSRGEMDQMGVKYPYCAVVAVEELDGGTWKVVPSALPQLNFLGFSNRFDPDYFNRA